MEFTKYKKLGAYHWKMYNDPNTKYHRHVNRVKDWVKEKNVLDIGAGDGLITFVMGWKGIDNEAHAIKLAKEKGAGVELGDAYKTGFEFEQFDAVFMGDTLEHLKFPKEALKEAKRITKKYLYLVLPEKGTNKDRFHYQEWNPDELKDLVERQGFRLVEDMMVVPQDKRIYAKFEKK